MKRMKRFDFFFVSSLLSYLSSNRNLNSITYPKGWWWWRGDLWRLTHIVLFSISSLQYVNRSIQLHFSYVNVWRIANFTESVWMSETNDQWMRITKKRTKMKRNRKCLMYVCCLCCFFVFVSISIYLFSISID
jgi:hypothetical protein